MKAFAQLVVHGDRPMFASWLETLVVGSQDEEHVAFTGAAVLVRGGTIEATAPLKTPAHAAHQLRILDEPLGCACCVGGPVLIQALVRALRYQPSWIWLATAGHSGEHRETAVFRAPGLAKYLQPLRPLLWQESEHQDQAAALQRWQSALVVSSPRPELSPQQDDHHAEPYPEGSNKGVTYVGAGAPLTNLEQLRLLSAY